MLVHDIEVLAEAEIHAPKRLAHLDHLLLDVLSILLCFLLVSLLENVFPVLCQLVIANFLKIRYQDVVCKFFHRVDFIVKAINEFILLMLCL